MTAHSAGASARRRARELRRAEIARQHRQGLPLFAGLLLVDLILIPTCASSSGLVRLAVLGVVFGGPVLVLRRVYRPGPDVIRWRHGAEGEHRTARLLRPLSRRGWTVLHDRALPATSANADHLVLLPDGRGGVAIDTKHLNRRGIVTTTRDGAGLRCAGRSYPDMLTGARRIATRVSDVLGVPVAPLIVVHGARVPHGRIRLDGLTIVSARQLRRELRSIPYTPDRQRAAALAARARQKLPPHTKESTR
ncbi:hypothetical protein GCM10009801_73090 [Streptomyces albiaxialis]|uniref:NERD domain-containing protein n=1 Tax=Streptomyces albiaxialis TaxID=329523 RepID=A0ABN2WXC4_9ACTN